MILMKIKLKIINHNFHIFSEDSVEKVEDLLCHLLGVVYRQDKSSMR